VTARDLVFSFFSAEMTAFVLGSTISASYLLEKNFQYFDNKIAVGVSLNQLVLNGEPLRDSKAIAHRFYPDFESPYEHMPSSN
jgi:hypothetical protein